MTRRVRRHDCEVEIKRNLQGFVLSHEPHGHRILRFRRSEVWRWLESRREARS